MYASKEQTAEAAQRGQGMGNETHLPLFACIVTACQGIEISDQDVDDRPSLIQPWYVGFASPLLPFFVPFPYWT